MGFSFSSELCRVLSYYYILGKTGKLNFIRTKPNYKEQRGIPQEQDATVATQQNKQRQTKVHNQDQLILSPIRPETAIKDTHSTEKNLGEIFHCTQKTLAKSDLFAFWNKAASQLFLNSQY